MEMILVMLLVAVAVAMVVAPLRPGHAGQVELDEDAARAELEAARDAKYREIRDVELDRDTGKLSDAEWRSQDRVLRREAMDLLERLDALDERAGAIATRVDPATGGG